MLSTKRWTFAFGLCLAIVAVSITACDKDDDDGPKTEYTISGNATGEQEVPAVNTPATGTLSGTYNINTNLLTYSINWTGLTAAPSMMHFHGPAPVGQNAPPVVHITGYTVAPTGSVSGTATLTDPQEQQLLDGLWYYNLHTPNHQGGEIRAQVQLQ